MLRGQAGQLHPGGDVELAEHPAQVKGDRVHAEEHVARYLAIAEPLGHQVHDAPLGVRQAGPAESGPVRVAPVPDPDPRGPQPGPDPVHAIGDFELLVKGVGLMQPIHSGSAVPLLGAGHPGVFGGPGPAEQARVCRGGPVQGGRVLLDQPADVRACRRHVTGAGAVSDQLLRRLRQLRSPGPVISGQRPPDQQDRGFRIRGIATEHGQPQVLLELTDVRMKVYFCAGHDTPHSAVLS